MRLIRALFGSIFVFASVACTGGGPQSDTDTLAAAETLTGAFLGQRPPGLEPALFAPGLVSTGWHELSISFSPAADEVFFFATGPAYEPRMILHCRLENGVWSTPREAVFSDPERTDSYPFVTPDGERVFFCSSRASATSGTRGDHHRDFWFVERSGVSWSEPRKVDFGADLQGIVAFPSVAANGNLYFNGILDTPSSDIYVSRFENGRHRTPKNLGPTVNDGAGNHHPFIAPDESYLLFDSEREEDTYGDIDLFVSLRRKDGTWSAAENLGPKVNTPFDEMSPYVSADGKYLFFSSSRPAADLLPAGLLTYEEISRRLHNPGNGLRDIYWVSTEAIQLP
jgi:ribosomal protein L24E